MQVVILGPIPIGSVGDFIPDLEKNKTVSPGVGGTCLVNLVRARLARGLPTDIITCDTQASEPVKKWHGKLVNLWVVKRRERRAMRDAYRQERRLIHQALSESDASVCHANWTYEYALAGLTQRKMPCVVSVHDHAGHILRLADARYLINYLITRLVFRRAKLLTAVSPYVAEYASKLSGKKVEVVPNFLPEIEWLGSKRKETANRTIVTLGHWGRGKNIKRAVKAFQIALARNPGFRYTLMGPDLGFNGRAHRWARQHRLDSHISFLGNLPYRDTVSRIAGSDVLLHPSVEESFGMPVAEAMLAGIPVVGCREAEGVRWLLDNGKSGRLVSAYSPKEMAAAVAETLEGSTITRQRTSAAKERIRTLCDTESSFRLLDEIYLKALRVTSTTAIGSDG